jgi:hypothetical protein
MSESVVATGLAACPAILIMAKALGKQVISALVRLQNQRGMVSGNALS